MTCVWEVELPPRENGEGGNVSLFYETRDRAMGAFKESRGAIWWNPEEWQTDTVRLYKVKLNRALTRKALLCACLTGVNYAESRDLVKEWSRKEGCPDLKDEHLLEEYLRGASPKELMEKYGIPHSTLYDRMMRARRRQG